MAGCLFEACATKSKVAPPPKPSPVKKAPEFGAPPTAKVTPHHSREIASNLKHKAAREMRSGKRDQAFSTLEQALRINPNDPAIWHMLAQIQLDRGNFGQAEQLARKSNLLAGKNEKLRRKNWRIIALALDRKGLKEEAAAAKRRAEKP